MAGLGRGRVQSGDFVNLGGFKYPTFLQSAFEKPNEIVMLCRQNINLPNLYLSKIEIK